MKLASGPWTVLQRVVRNWHYLHGGKIPSEMTQCYLQQILLFSTRINLGRCSVVQSRCGQNIVKPRTYMPRLLKTRYTVVWYKCAQNSSSWQFHTIFHLPLCHFRLLGPWYLLSSDRGTPAGIKITKHLTSDSTASKSSPSLPPCQGPWALCTEVFFDLGFCLAIFYLARALDARIPWHLTQQQYGEYWLMY